MFLLFSCLCCVWKKLAVAYPFFSRADQWSVQDVVRKLVSELQGRGYLVWLDLERMQGSIVDVSARCEA